MAAAHIHTLSALSWAASQLYLPTLADAGYHGAGAGVHTPVIKPAGRPYHALHVDNRTYNQLLRGLLPSVNAPPPSSPNAGAPSATSPSAPAASAISPAPQSSSTTGGNRNR